LKKNRGGSSRHSPAVLYGSEFAKGKKSIIIVCFGTEERGKKRREKEKFLHIVMAIEIPIGPSKVNWGESETTGRNELVSNSIRREKGEKGAQKEEWSISRTHLSTKGNNKLTYLTFGGWGGGLKLTS